MTRNGHKSERRVAQVLRGALYHKHAAHTAQNKQRGIVYNIECCHNVKSVVDRTDDVAEILPEFAADGNNERLTQKFFGQNFGAVCKRTVGAHKYSNPLLLLQPYKIILFNIYRFEKKTDIYKPLINALEHKVGRSCE